MYAYTGQIILFAGDYVPQNWALCDGSTLRIQDYPALFSLIGTVYGGDSRITFGLPDLRGRAPVGLGQGTGLTSRTLGQSFGTEAVSLDASQIPPHQHKLQALTTAANALTPTGNLLAQTQNQDVAYFTPPAGGTAPTTWTLAANSVADSAGGNAPHENRMPTQVLNYLICLNSIYPERLLSSVAKELNMSSSFIGEVRAFPYTFAPDGWLDCMGQLVSVHQYQLLFAVIGSRYGGDHRTTFGLPNLCGRVAIGQGQLHTNGQATGANYVLGQSLGVPEVTLSLPDQLPRHTHTITSKFLAPTAAPNASGNTPTSQAYPSRMFDKSNSTSFGTYIPPASASTMTTMSPLALSTAPPTLPAAHENRQPYTTLRFCICATDGDYPVRP